MKRFLSILSLVFLGFAAVSCYDDAELRESITDLDGRVKTLETLCTEMNSNLSALVTVVEAMKVGDYVVSVSELKEDGVFVGYRIVFKENGPVDLYHGKNGKDGADGENGKDGENGTNGNDGHSPVLGTKQDTDGAYYWTIDGEWVLDGEGKKIPLVTVGATPQLKIEEEKWYVSYDDKKSWEELGAAVSVGIKDIKPVDGELVITMADGTEIAVPLGSPMKVVLGDFDATTLQVGNDLVIPYTIEGVEGDVTVFLLKDGDGFIIDLVEESALAGKVTISQQDATSKEMKGKIGIFAVAEDGTTVSKAVKFTSGVFTTVEGNQEEYAVEGKGGKVEFTVATNTQFEVKIPAEATWITYVETKAVEEKTLEFTVAANEGADRTAQVKVVSGNIEISFTITQAGGYVAAPEETLVGVYKIHYFWVYGGTGPQYGSAGWVDLHNKEWWFDKSTGHGIAAERDNYLEFTLTEFNADGTQSTGTCINWAGKDGKNWDTWFYNNKDIKANPDAPKDGTAFYRQIPIGTSTWVRDYTVTPNTVTFTDAEGKKTTLEILEPGYKFVPGYQDNKAETNTRTFPRNAYSGDNDDLTFHAKVKGTDNWETDRNYELDKLFYNPRDFFIDVDKVEEVPADSKTTEAKWVPEFPEAEVVTSIAGTYKFRDGKTVGGKVLPEGENKGNVTAKGLIEQYGGWSDKRPDGQKFCDVINKMKNDKYTFVATGTDANGNETGTVSFDDGGDGTWDYVVLDNKVSPYVAYDATDLYGIIAHDNTTTYVYNATSGKVTLTTGGKEYVLDFLVPGTYKYSSQNVTVPAAAAFGLHLDLGYTEARVKDYKYTDNGFARHYVWARDHVFMFDKQ